METLTMNRRERRRLELMGRVARGELTLRKAAELMEMSYRQAKRVSARYREQGDAGLVHRLRGRPSNRRSDPRQHEQVLTAYREKYADFGPTLAAEYLLREEGLVVGVETLRRWLLAAGLWRKRKGRPQHRRWRARKEHVGEMVQMDGSHHDWFEGRRPKAVLMVMIDDATNRTYARLFEQETTVAAMTTFGCYVQQHGLPQSLYVDRDSIYETTRDATMDEELAERGPLTQFGRAMQELGVRLILARSPQAKGRVERRNAVFQDRLVKALRRCGISDLAAANQYLEATFLPELNQRFTVEPQRRADLHRKLPRPMKLELVLSFQESRRVQNDWTVRWRNRWLQIAAQESRRALIGKKILVCEQLDGTLRLLHRGIELDWKELCERPPVIKVAPAGRPKRAVSYAAPAANHPWRRDRLCPGTPAARLPCSASGSLQLPARPARSKAGGKKQTKTLT